MQAEVHRCNEGLVLSRASWKERGFRVPTKALPIRYEGYRVPGYRAVYRTRHLFGFDQVVPVNPTESQARSVAAAKAVSTRMQRMEERMKSVELTIVPNKSDEELYTLALRTHGGNYRGDPGEFHWSNNKARNVIRHCLTNYELQWALINRGYTGSGAYSTLRHRVDALIDESYPRFAEGMPEVKVSRGSTWRPDYRPKVHSDNAPSIPPE